MQLRNQTRSSSKVGQLVKAVKGGFTYAGLGDTPIGVVTEVVAAGAMCDIQTNGIAKVRVARAVVEGDDLRLTIENEGGGAGVAYAVGTAAFYTAIGSVVKGGKGLVDVALNLSAAGSYSGETSSVPDGGTSGQVLTKQSGSDGDVYWATPSTGISEAPYSSTTTPRPTISDPQGVAYSRYNGTWVDSGLVIDASGGVGAQLRTVGVGERITFVGDGTYIGTSYSYASSYSGVHEIALTFTPGALVYTWDLMTADGQAATPRSYSTANIGNTANVVFLEGQYTTLNYNLNLSFTDYTPTLTEPANEVTIDVDITALDGRYYTETEVDTLLSSYALTSWVNSNFDDYNGFDIYTTVYRDTILSGEKLDFAASGAGLGVNYDAVNNLLTYTFTPAGSYYDGWDIDADTGGTGSDTVVSTALVTFIGGTNINTALAYATPGGSPPVTADITINLDSTVSGLTSLSAATITSTGSVIANSNVYSSNTNLFLGTTGAGVIYLRPNGYSSSTNQLTISNTQTTVRTAFQVENAATTIANFTSTVSGYSRITINAASNADSQLSFQEATGTKWSIGNDAGTDSFIIRKGFGAFGTDDYFKIHTTGYVEVPNRLGLGTSTPGAQIDAYGTIAAPPEIRVSNIGGSWAADNVVGKFVFYSRDASGIGAREVGKITSFTDTPGASAGFGLRFYVGPYNGTITEALKILDDKNAYFAGSVYSTGEMEAYDTSDIRLKENVSDIQFDRSVKLLKARVVEYDHVKKERHEIGLIAQEVKEIFPEAVKEDQDGFLMIQYGRLIAPMLQLIQNQESRINELERRLSRY
jgi:hypothetical protein